MAVELSEALGRKIVFENPSVDEYCASLEKMGVTAYIIQHLSGAMVDYQHGHMLGSDNNVEKLTGLRSASGARNSRPLAKRRHSALVTPFPSHRIRIPDRHRRRRRGSCVFGLLAPPTSRPIAYMAFSEPLRGALIGTNGCRLS